MNLVTNKKLLLIGVGVTLVIVSIFVILAAVINRPSGGASNTTTTTVASINNSALASGEKATNSAIVDLNLSDSTIKLPTVTLSNDPLTSSLASITSVISSNVSSTGVSSITSISSSTPKVTDPKAPTNLYVTNKDYKIWSVIWTTTTPTVGKLKYGTSSNTLDKVISDDRTALSTTKSYTHEVSITNADTLLNTGNPTFYYKILSDDIEYGDGSVAYRYINAPLLSSPSSPVNVVVSLSKAVSNNDSVILGRIKTGTEYSEWVSSVLSGTNSILNIGIARKSNLNSYMNEDSSSTLEISVLGPSGSIIGTKTNISLTNIEDTSVAVTATPTVGASSVSSSVSPARSSSGTSVANSSSAVIPALSNTSNTSSLMTVPKTAIEDDLSLAVILLFSLVILIIGTSGLYRINAKQSFARRVLEGDD